jgi:hypothetical protein
MPSAQVGRHYLQQVDNIGGVILWSVPDCVIHIASRTLTSFVDVGIEEIISSLRADLPDLSF